MDVLRRLFLNRTFILGCGLAGGLLWGKGAFLTEVLTIPVLALVMTMATVGIDTGALRSIKALGRPFCLGLVMNYGILSGVILLLSRLFITDPHLAAGFALMAAVPPAVAVIPFTHVLKGDDTLSFLGTLGAYVAGLVITPLVIACFFGTSFASPGRLLATMVELILLPFIAGRALEWFGAGPVLIPLKGPVVNWSFSLITYTIVGLNREMLLHHPLSIAPTAIVVVLTTFLLGWLIEVVARRVLRLSFETTTSLILLGTLKNYGIAGGLALSLFSRETASPATVASVFMIVYIIWLEWTLGRRKDLSHRRR